MQQIIEAVLYFPEGSQALAESLLRECGVNSFVEGNPTLTLEVEDSKDIFTCYFNSEQEFLTLIASLNEHFPTKIAYQIRFIDNQDWQTAWQEHWQIERVGKIVIVPHFLTYEQSPDEIVITIDPQMAFGTGTHETTKLCLEALSTVIAKNDVASFLDVGCGTGILALAARKLGVGEIAAVDINDEIISIAKGNATQNGVEDIFFSSSSLDHIPVRKYDLICANIISSELEKLWPHLKTLLAKNGAIILSGILSSELASFKKKLKLTPRKIYRAGEWVALTIHR